MRNLFTIQMNRTLFDFAMLIVRVGVAAFMLTHGYPKLSKLLSGGEIQFADPFGAGATLSLVLVVFAEFFCSILVGIGFATRLAVIPLMLTMSTAAFVAHSADPFARKELALLYLLIYFFLLVTGSGKFSIDYFLSRRSR